MLLICYLSVAFWKNTENPTLLKFLNFQFSASDLEDKKTEYNRYNNELNTISKHYAEMSKIEQKIAKWKGAFKNDKKTKLVNQFWEVQDIARMVKEKSKAEPVPLKNTHKRLFSEIGDDLPSSHIMSVMEKYHAKSTTSKYDLVHSFILDLTPCSQIEKEVETEFWVELIAD
ncbi:27500_t:CDS:2, partial [Racocetra persica]